MKTIFKITLIISVLTNLSFAVFQYKTLNFNFNKLVNDGKLVLENGKISFGKIAITADDFEPKPIEVLKPEEPKEVIK